MTTSKHFIGPGNVYRTPEGDIVVVSYVWSIMSADCLQVHPELAWRVLSPEYLRNRCQFIGKRYYLRPNH